MLEKTAFLLQHRTMQAKSILNGSSFSPFIFHSKVIYHVAKSFGDLWRELWQICCH